MAMQTPNSSFPLFPDLPPELRLKIWRHTLPDHVPPALFTWNSGCWSWRHFHVYGPGYESDPDDLHLIVEFQHTMLKPTRFNNIPLLSVNSEARTLALSWAANNGIEHMRVVPQETNANADAVATPSVPISGPLTRCFKPEYDAVFVPRLLWAQFLYEGMFQVFDPDYENRIYEYRSQVCYIAVTEGIINDGDEYVQWKDILEYFPSLQAVYLVVGAIPEELDCNAAFLSSGKKWEGAAGIPRRWEVDEGKAWEIVLKNESQGGVDSEWFVMPDNKKNLIDGALSTKLMVVAKDLHEGMIEHRISDFRIRFVHMLTR